MQIYSMSVFEFPNVRFRFWATVLKGFLLFASGIKLTGSESGLDLSLPAPASEIPVMASLRICLPVWRSVFP